MNLYDRSSFCTKFLVAVFSSTKNCKDDTHPFLSAVLISGVNIIYINNNYQCKYYNHFIFTSHTQSHCCDIFFLNVNR